MYNQITDVNEVTTYREGQPDNIFICCAGFEERSLGIISKLKKYRYDNGFIFAYTEPKGQESLLLLEMEKSLNNCGHYTKIPTTENDPIPAIAHLGIELQSLGLNPDKTIITLDITSFTKLHLLLILKLLDNLGYWKSLRIFYTEPKEYITEIRRPTCPAIKQLDPVPGFVNTQSLNKPVLLVMFLGYEGNRALALYNILDPNETMLIIPKPAYHEEWEGRTEDMNKYLINMLGSERIEYAHSTDPYEVARSLSKVLLGDTKYNLKDWICSILPFGTKPQTMGLYLFWREHKGEFSIIYANNFENYKDLDSQEIGKTWLLHSPEIIE